MNIYLYGLLWVAGAAITTAAIAYLVRRIGATYGTVDNNEAAGQVFTIVGGLQAVLVAFVLISLFDAVSAADDGSYTEADSLVAAAWAADSLPEPARTQIQQLSQSYADTVIAQEWPRLRTGTQITGDGWTQLDQLRTTIANAPADDGWTIDRKTEAANQLWQVYQARQQRLDAATSEGVSAVVWFALIGGGVMSIALPLMFGGPRPAIHIMIVSTLAATITMLLFAIYQLQNPFSGGVRLDPVAFQSALDRLW